MSVTQFRCEGRVSTLLEGKNEPLSRAFEVYHSIEQMSVLKVRLDPDEVYTINPRDADMAYFKDVIVAADHLTFGVKTDANDQYQYGKVFLSAPTVATSLEIQALGIEFYEGIATDLSEDEYLIDTEAAWTYSRWISAKTLPPFTFDRAQIVLAANGKMATIAVTGDADSGSDIATAIQTAIDATELNGELTVSFDDDEDKFKIVNDRAGARDIHIRAIDTSTSEYAKSLKALRLLGFGEGRIFSRGGDDLSGYKVQILAGTSAGDIRTIDSNTDIRLDPTANFSDAPDITSPFRIYEPTETHNEVRIYLGR